MADLPTYITRGEPARLFPVLATTSKEGRTTSIVLACMTQIKEFGDHLLLSIGQRLGSTMQIEAWTEVEPAGTKDLGKDRPDGLIMYKRRGGSYSALIETKIGSNELNVEQIERYRDAAARAGIDCVITISNQFTSSPELHPVSGLSKAKSKVPVFHWSWMYVLTTADLLLNNQSVKDQDQRVLLNELRRFLSHDSAGVKGFDRMPREWTELNKLVTAGGSISSQPGLGRAVIEAWHQETRDLTLILSRMTETAVTEKLPRKLSADAALRQKTDLDTLKGDGRLNSVLEIPDSAAPLEIAVNVPRRTIRVGMCLRAPEDKKSTKARLNWLLRQIDGAPDSVFIRLFWPGKSEPTQFSVSDLKEDLAIAEAGKEHLAPHSFMVLQSSQTGGRFAQQANFIEDLERLVPAFYKTIGSSLKVWLKPAPKIKHDRSTVDDVSPDALLEDASEFSAEAR
ncbi:MAG: hypothetical protein ACU0DW_14375 [Shimia sp.]